ncbi:hypothetical protein CB1_000993041 [Camelus ferus]|nr:hypothetical protein CB1_000993041 [Camelus ferus]
MVLQTLEQANPVVTDRPQGWVAWKIIWDVPMPRVADIGVLGFSINQAHVFWSPVFAAKEEGYEIDFLAQEKLLGHKDLSSKVSYGTTELEERPPLCESCLTKHTRRVWDTCQGQMVAVQVPLCHNI